MAIDDLVINYKSQAFMNDMLLFEGHIDNVNRFGFRLSHRITRNGALIALSETGMFPFNYEKVKIVSIPEELLHALEDYHGMNKICSGYDGC